MAKVNKIVLPSGQIRYETRPRIGGRVVTRRFKRKHDADAFANTTEADKVRGVAVDPRHGRVTLTEYANLWLRQRTGLAQRTSELYRDVLDRHILPRFGTTTIALITPIDVRTWNAELAQRHPSTAAKAYRLLSTMMRTAIADELITRNPCVVKGASAENAAERPIATVAEVEALTDAMPARMRIAPALAAWCQLRRGELLGLRRGDIDLMNRTVTIALTRGTGTKGTTIVKEPKTDAGRRILAIPPNLIPLIRDHLANYVRPEADALVLTGEKGGPLRPHVLQAKWAAARTEVGRPDLRLHDLPPLGPDLDCDRRCHNRRAHASRGPQVQCRRLALPARHDDP